MDHPLSPPKAALPARRAVNDELQVQAYNPISDHSQERRQSLYLRQQFIITRLFSFIFRPNQLLPISNAPLVPAPGLKETISLRRRSRGSQHNDTRADESTRSNRSRCSTVDELNGQGEMSRKEGEESSCGSSFSNSDIQRKRHKTRIEALTKHLKPMLPEDGSAVILLCWGEKSGCSILPVHVSITEDEVSMWSKIHSAWYARRGYWRKHLPGFCVSQVEVVEVSILGLKEPSNGRERVEYIGKYTESDITAAKRSLQDIIDTCVPTSDCYYNRYTGNVDCGFDCMCWDCFSELEDAEECTVKVLRDTKRKISLLDARALLRHVFSNPVLAASNDFLKREELALSHQDVLSHFSSWHSWHCPCLTELKFRGLVISEDWTLNMRRKAWVIFMFSVVVLASKFLFGWDTAWTVGGCFVALVTLFLGKLQS